MGSAVPQSNCTVSVIRNLYRPSSPFERASKIDLDHVLAWLVMDDRMCALPLLVYLTSKQLNRGIIQAEIFVMTFMSSFHFYDCLIYESNLAQTHVRVKGNQIF